MKKEFRTATDLAINGAPPAFDEALHVGRPNIGDRALFDSYVDHIYKSVWLTNNGPLVQELEQKIAGHLGVKHCVAMCNGTIALEIAIRALGMKGEVIVPSFTFIATAHALSWQGIQPVFADIDSHTHNLDPISVRRMITPQTTGIIGVHLWGRPAPIDELQAIANEHGLKLMFDAAHAFGVTYKGTSIGSFGECEVLSFHATKFFNAFEGGAVVTNNDKLAEQMRLMRNFGFAGLDNVIYPGTNGKMSEISAAMGLTNLQHIANFLNKNRENYDAYRAHLESIREIGMLHYDAPGQFNYQYIVAQVQDDFPVSRDRLIDILYAENVRARRYFWPGCHQMSPYAGRQATLGSSLKNTSDIGRKVMVLPTGSSISTDQIQVISSIIKCVSLVGD